ncbi:MAG: hypothetical protein IJD20_06710 [Oscillospiraceae bacterium]|nr:hypothetical protein [Oscillospiraceae bacterium]
MKIEMGESLFYSWLRHVKDCQIVQNNWRPSSQWTLLHSEEVESLWHEVDAAFQEKFGYEVFKKTTSLSQLLQQTECDAIGISIQDGAAQYYTVDVAFHEAGLNYGTREETVTKVVAKCIRTAFCLYGYIGVRKAEIVFASPKINPSVLADITPCIELLNRMLRDKGFDYSVRVLCNDEFNTLVMQPILIASEGVADTAELFMRAYQLFSMFGEEKTRRREVWKTFPSTASARGNALPDSYNELKIGKLAQTVLRDILENESLSEEELRWLQTAQYSKQMFDLQYPLLVSEETEFDSVRYYAKPLFIHGKQYYMCSQWFETSANNDRPYLLKWIEKHLRG